MNAQTVETTVGHYINLFKAHERLFLLLAAGFFAVHFYSKGIDYLTKRDQTQADTAKTVAQQAVNKVTVDDGQTKLLIAQLNTLQQETIQQRAKLDADIAARAKSTANQKAVDDKSTLSALAPRLQELVGVGQVVYSGPETPGATGYVRLDETAAHKTTDDEEDLLQLRAVGISLTTELAGCESVGTKQSDAIAGLNTEIADNKIALTTEQNSHAADVKTLKSKNRTSWLHGFKWGFITGIVAGEAARIALIHKP